MKRYFWGVARSFKGKPMTKEASKSTESILKVAFQTTLPAPTIVHDEIFTPAAVVGSKASAVPIHTSKTQYGFAAIYDFGVSDNSLGPEWFKWKRKASNKHSKSVEFQLKPQMRGRHMFGAGSKAKNRCFEWRVIRDKDRCGAPKFRVSEFLRDGKGFREQTTSISASTPNQLWNKLFTEVLGFAAPERGAHLCGFDDLSLAALLKVHFEGGIASYDTFLKFDDLTDRYKRHTAGQVSDAFWETMRKVCLKDPIITFHALRESARFQADCLFEGDTTACCMTRLLLGWWMHTNKHLKTVSLGFSAYLLHNSLWLSRASCSM